MQVNRYSPIMEGQSWLSPPRRSKTPEMGVKQDSTSPPRTGVLEAVSLLGRSEVPASRQPGRFTNTAVPRFYGTVYWQQHQQVFNECDSKIEQLGGMRRRHCAPLFTHLEGEALNVALLMPEGERATGEGLSQGLSEYYNSLGRLAVFRRKFDSVARREGEDPLLSPWSRRSWRFGVSGISAHRPKPGWSGTGSSRNNKVAD